VKQSGASKHTKAHAMNQIISIKKLYSATKIIFARGSGEIDLV
jgi:hypothetical protein